MDIQNKFTGIESIGCKTIEDRAAICHKCKNSLYIWYVAKAGENRRELLCGDCKEHFLPFAPKVAFSVLNEFFLVLFEESIKLKRVGDLLLVTNTNRRTIEGGLISRQLRLINLKELIEAGMQESLIEKALDFSLPTQDPKRFLSREAC